MYPSPEDNMVPLVMRRQMPSSSPTPAPGPRDANGGANNASSGGNGSGNKFDIFGGRTTFTPRLFDLGLLLAAYMVFRITSQPPPPPTTYWKWAAACGTSLTFAAATARYALKNVLGTSRPGGFANALAKMAAASGILAASAFLVGVFLASRLPTATDTASELAVVTTAVFAVPSFTFYLDPFGSTAKWFNSAHYDQQEDNRDYASPLHPQRFHRVSANANNTSNANHVNR